MRHLEQGRWFFHFGFFKYKYSQAIQFQNGGNNKFASFLTDALSASSKRPIYLLSRYTSPLAQEMVTPELLGL